MKYSTGGETQLPDIQLHYDRILHELSLEQLTQTRMHTFI